VRRSNADHDPDAARPHQRPRRSHEHEARRGGPRRPAGRTPTGRSYVARPAGKPGAGYHYANTNYVPGLIVERITGRTLAQEFRSRFFEPLGLTSASYQAEPPAAELPTAYRYSSIRLDARPQDVTDGSDIRPFTSTRRPARPIPGDERRRPARWGHALYGGDVLPPDLPALMLDDGP
jgi:D-alanyl-D-alanine carboxypeptidase